MIKKRILKELQQKLASVKCQMTQQKLCVCLLKFLRDEIAAVLHSCLPDPLGKRSFIFIVLKTKYERYEIYRPSILANQITHILRANDNINYHHL